MTKPSFDGVGRNDPCPCGSGKKFKKCCANAQKPKFTAKVIKGGTGLGLRALMQKAANQIEEGERLFHKKKLEKEQESSSSA